MSGGGGGYGEIAILHPWIFCTILPSCTWEGRNVTRLVCVELKLILRAMPTHMLTPNALPSFLNICLISFYIIINFTENNNWWYSDFELWTQPPKNKIVHHASNMSPQPLQDNDYSLRYWVHSHICHHNVQGGYQPPNLHLTP